MVKIRYVDQMRIATVVGARPQFIKASAVSRALKNRGHAEIVIHTGQHYDQNMAGVFFEELDIPRPDYSLGISGLSHGAMTGEMLKQIEKVLVSSKPDAVLVYGDTNSTLAGALAASKLMIPIAHVEAGLRSFNLKMPEEINRILTDRISTWLFCPTPVAMENLEKEPSAVRDAKVQLVGDVMYDVALTFSKKSRLPSSFPPEFAKKGFGLCTLHRQENTDNIETLKSLVEGLRSVSKLLPIVWPIHPRTRAALDANHVSTDGLFLLEPVGYLEMIGLLKSCRCVLTDSGGLQKEAYFFEKPCLTLRSETEWVELVEAGVNVLCGHDAEILEQRTIEALSISNAWPKGLYGNGRASELIAQSL